MPSPFQPERTTKCGGFSFELDDGTTMRLVLAPGHRALDPELPEAVLRGLEQARSRFAFALRLEPARLPYQRVEVSLRPGTVASGEARGVASGLIRLILGESTSLEEAAGIAMHEALHLFLAANLSAGEPWNSSEIAFADWMIRGIEAGLSADVPRFSSPLPKLFEPLPTSRLEVLKLLEPGSLMAESARALFGGPLHEALVQVDADELDQEFVRRRKLWLVEAALGTHFLESAGRLLADDGPGFLAVLLDDWLFDYQRYAGGLGNAPSGTGSLWRLSDPEWSREPVVRLAAAAQGAQLADRCWFTPGVRGWSSEPLLWRKHGRVRLPLLAPSGPQPEPIGRFREALRAINAPLESKLLEEAAREARGFEACALWPRLLARLFAANISPPESQPGEPPLVCIVEGEGGEAARAHWSDSLRSLRELLGEHAGFVPDLLGPLRLEELGRMTPGSPAMTLVHGGPATGSQIFAVRTLAAERPIRGALFTAIDGAVYERLPDQLPPLDPRYREAIFSRAQPDEPPRDLPAMVRVVDLATEAGTLTTPLSHALSMMAPGIDECHYPRCAP